MLRLDWHLNQSAGPLGKRSSVKQYQNSNCATTCGSNIKHPTVKFGWVLRTQLLTSTRHRTKNTNCEPHTSIVADVSPFLNSHHSRSRAEGMVPSEGLGNEMRTVCEQGGRRTRNAQVIRLLELYFLPKRKRRSNTSIQAAGVGVVSSSFRTVMMRYSSETSC